MRILGTLRDSLGQPFNGTVKFVPASPPRVVDNQVVVSDPVTVAVSGGALDVTLTAGAYAMFTSPPTQPLRLLVPEGSGTVDLPQIASSFANIEPAKVSLPAGGSPGTVLGKTGPGDYEVGWVANGTGGAHASTHAATGDDPVTPAAIGAAPASHTHPLSQLEQSGASTGQVPQWNGSTWTPATISGGGGGGIPEAPVDGFAYARRNAGWINADTRYVPPARQITAGNGLTGGGDLSADRSLSLTGQAAALHNLSVNGLIARTGAGTVAARTITAGANINISNGDGVAGNPVVAVSGLAAIAISGSAGDLTSGTVPAARLNLTADGNMLRRFGGVLQERTPSQVLSDIGAAIAAAGVPVGGTLNQVLSKASASDYNTFWRSILEVPNVGAGEVGKVLKATAVGVYEWSMVMGSTEILITEYDAPGSYNYNFTPGAAGFFLLWLVGGGGGGGSGRLGAAGSARSGGGGGAGGSTVFAIMPHSLFSAGVIPVNIASGGLGGAAVTTLNTDGNAGLNCTTDTSFGGNGGAGNPGVRARGGSGGGGGGVSSGGSAGGGIIGGVGGFTFGPGSGGSGGANGAAGNSSAWTNTAVLNLGGGGGGGVQTTDVATNGGSGRSSVQFKNGGSQGAGGNGGVNGGAGTSGNFGGFGWGGGGGGGGGGTQNGGPGGDGWRGGGGGGGGGGTNGFSSGAGGNGGDGYALIISVKVN